MKRWREFIRKGSGFEKYVFRKVEKSLKWKNWEGIDGRIVGFRSFCRRGQHRGNTEPVIKQRRRNANRKYETVSFYQRRQQVIDPKTVKVFQEKRVMSIRERTFRVLQTIVKVSELREAVSERNTAALEDRERSASTSITLANSCLKYKLEL